MLRYRIAHAWPAPAAGSCDRRTRFHRARNAALPKTWSGWPCVLMTYRIGLSVRARIAASSCCPSRTLPPVSITATALSPMMNPILAIAPSFSRVISAVTPVMHEYAGRDFADRQALAAAPAIRSMRRAIASSSKNPKRHEPYFCLSLTTKAASIAQSFHREASLRRSMQREAITRIIPVARHGSLRNLWTPASV